MKGRILTTGQRRSETRRKREREQRNLRCDGAESCEAGNAFVFSLRQKMGKWVYISCLTIDLIDIGIRCHFFSSIFHVACLLLISQVVIGC
jgi:hypothetical protein